MTRLHSNTIQHLTCKDQAKRLLVSCAMAFTSGSALPSHAETASGYLQDYWGLSYQLVTVDAPGIAAIAPLVPVFSIGHHLEPGLALEVQIGLPSSEETVQWNGQTLKQKVNSLLTGRFRKGILNHAGFETYGVLGITYSDLNSAVIQNNQLVAPKKQSVDLSYGLGTRFQLGQSNMTGHLEYNRLLTLSNFNLSSLQLGINYYF